MAQFHNIFCVSDTPLATAEIAALAGETWYGDGAPSLDIAFDDSPAWDRFENAPSGGTAIEGSAAIAPAAPVRTRIG
jgi:hypothetical protein